MSQSDLQPDLSPGAPPADSDSEAALSKRPTVATRLLVAVNSVCLVLLLVFMAHDYNQEFKRRLSDRRVALQEESTLILQAVREIQHHGLQQLQHFVDSACAQMKERHSPGHHVIVRLPGHDIQATTHGRDSTKMLKAVTAAAQLPAARGVYEGRELIVGAAGDQTITVFVSEFTGDLRQQALLDITRRFAALTAMAIVAAIVVNYVLLRIVVRPIHRLVNTVRAIGHGEFGKHTTVFRSRELSFLAHAVNQMSTSLAKSEKDRQSELDKARRVQQNLLPDTNAISGAQIAVHYEPAEDVAGDFYDIQTLPDGSWAILFADVTGHGIPAAMNATLLKSHFAEACEKASDVLHVVRHVNRRFSKLTLIEDFATAIVLRFEPTSGQLQLVNAGHDSALFLKPSGDLHEVRSSGLVMGLVPDADWSAQSLQVTAGDRLLIYTDGITETMGDDAVMFGRDKVISVYQQTAEQPPDKVVQMLVESCRQHRGRRPQMDDITIMLLQF